MLLAKCSYETQMSVGDIKILELQLGANEAGKVAFEPGFPWNQLV